MWRRGAFLSLVALGPIVETQRPRSPQPGKEKVASNYPLFDQLDGCHPWRDALRDGYIDYPARICTHGKVAYFNFRLARDMGLLPVDHPDELSDALHEKLIETFSLRILNEYDHILGQHVPPDRLKPNLYMATRYLQDQHADPSGRTSGDGRSIWNGVCRNQGAIWDVSSLGTGVTALSPGAVEADRPLETGSEEFGYGCGLSELDELFEAALLSEIFFLRGLCTERTLVIVDIGQGHGIGVRAAQNLIRPAHCFTYLRQDNRDGLERSLDYLIERQHANGEWSFSPQHPQKWDLLLSELCDSFAAFAAILDIDHIFVWAESDGDNVLADAGIIDYGSVRQFGLRHDAYRYNDVQRLSTSLGEQPDKLKLLVQCFAQAVDFVECGTRRPLEEFERHEVVLRYSQLYAECRLQRILLRLGFDESTTRRLLTQDHEEVEAFAAVYDAIEGVKASGKIRPVLDGVNQKPLFNIRNLLRAYPGFLRKQDDFEAARLPNASFFDLLFARETDARDRILARDHTEQAAGFQDRYKQLVVKAAERGSVECLLEDMERRSGIVNAADRATGDAITNIAKSVLRARDAGISVGDLGKLIDDFVEHQRLDPDQPRAEAGAHAGGDVDRHLREEILLLLEAHSEDI